MMKIGMQGGGASGKIESDVAVIGAGVIGLAIALELERRGWAVAVIERGSSLSEASTAAGGMLAVEDPHNPPEMLPLSRLSGRLFPGFLGRIEELSGIVVPFQTETTLQYLEGGGTVRLEEHSIDPGQLAGGLMAAVWATSIQLLEQTRVTSLEETGGGVRLVTEAGMEIMAKAVVYAAGAWTAGVTSELAGEVVPVTPRKGQIMRVQVPAGLELNEVHRSGRIYVMPRMRGAQAGSAIIGATVEDVGFDTTARAEDVARLRALAAELIPELGSEIDAPLIEAWAGLRPATPDLLPCIGALGEVSGGQRPRQFVASGHFRNGILWAPGTAEVIADLIEGREPGIDISGLSPRRFSSSEQTETVAAHVGR
jgi:glycine oxidase